MRVTADKYMRDIGQNQIDDNELVVRRPRHKGLHGGSLLDTLLTCAVAVLPWNEVLVSAVTARCVALG